MKTILIICVLLFNISAFADCGLNGSFDERVADCKTSHKTLKLVMSKQGSKYWFSPGTKSIFQVVASSGWFQAQANCESKKNDLSFPDPLYDWGLSVAKEITLEVTEVYPQLNISDYDEDRYWLGDLYNHPSGQKWAAFYSTKGYIDKWFQDAGDGIYLGGICSIVLK